MSELHIVWSLIHLKIFGLFPFGYYEYAAMNIVCVLVCKFSFKFLLSILSPEVELLDCMVIFFFVFLVVTILFLTMVMSIYLLPAMHKGSILSNSCYFHLLLLLLLVNVILLHIKQYFLWFLFSFS